MKINDILKEDSDSSGDYQKMLTFIRANRVGGVPDDQQVPLALFKELQRQKQQNRALSSELSDAEKRINQAMATGELSKQELGMHRSELDRERAAGEKQQAAIGQLGQQYAEREKASKEQIEQLTNQLEQVKNKPGVDAEAAKELERQIKELGEKSVPVDRLQELESSIAAVQNMQQVDDSAIKDLVAQVKDAQEATKEIEKTKQSIKQDVQKTVQDTQDQVAQMRNDIEKLRKVEQGLRNDIDELSSSYQETDAVVWDLESDTIPYIKQDVNRLKTAIATDKIPVPAAPNLQVQTPPPPNYPQTPAAEPASTATDTTQQPANEPAWWTSAARQKAAAEKLYKSGHLQQEPNFQAVAESEFKRSIEWAIGKKI